MRTYFIAFASACALIGCAYSQDLRGSQLELRQAVAAQFPAGTPVEAALKRMKAAGYRCRPDRPQGDQVLCSATSLMRDVDWRVIFTVKDGRVEGISADRWVTFL